MAVSSPATKQQNAPRQVFWSFGTVDKPLLVLISCLGLVLAGLAGLDTGLTGLALVGLGLLLGMAFMGFQYGFLGLALPSLVMLACSVGFVVARMRILSRSVRPDLVHRGRLRLYQCRFLLALLCLAPACSLPMDAGRGCCSALVVGQVG